MADIFMSYTRADAEKVGPLAAALEERGFSVFWDTEVLPGQLWRDVIHDELVGAACVIVVWSEGSIRSRWVGEEASEALEAGKLLPVLLDGTLPPFGFRAVEAANLSEWTPGSTNPEFENLVNAVQRIVAAAAGDDDAADAVPASDVGEVAPTSEPEIAGLVEETDTAAAIPPEDEVDTTTPTEEVVPAPPTDEAASYEDAASPPEVETPIEDDGADLVPPEVAVPTPPPDDAVETPPPDVAATEPPPDDAIETPPDRIEATSPPDEAVPTRPPVELEEETTPPVVDSGPPAAPTQLPPRRREPAPQPEGIVARLGTGGLLGIGAAIVVVIVAVIAFAGGDGDPPPTTLAGGGVSTTVGQVTTVADGEGATQVVESDTVTAFLAASAPVIDGDLGDWEGVPEAFRLQTEVFRDPDVVNRLGNDSPGVVLARYDNSALYLAVVSGDDIYSQQNVGNQIWRGDALDINLTTAAAGAISERPDGDDFQLTMTPRNADGQPSIVWFTGNGTGFADNTTELPVVLAGAFDGSGGWQLEAAIPWSVFGLSGPPSGDLAALVAVFDNDGEVVDGRPQQTVILGHTSAEFQRPLTWGTLALER